MELRHIRAAELVDAEAGSVSGLVKLEGWLVFKPGGERGWIAASYKAAPEPVVFLAESEQIYEQLNSNVSILGGGPFDFVNLAMVEGSLGLVGDEYVLSDVDDLEVFESVMLSLKPPPQLIKKTE